jgi:hypothetical protein
MTIYGRVMNYGPGGVLLNIQYYPLLEPEVYITGADETKPVLTYPELPDFENGDIIQGDVPLDVCPGSYNGNYPTY